MTVKGVTRNVDATGRVCIPKEYLQMLGVTPGADPVEIRFIIDDFDNPFITIVKCEEHTAIKKFIAERKKAVDHE